MEISNMKQITTYKKLLCAITIILSVMQLSHANGFLNKNSNLYDEEQTTSSLCKIDPSRCKDRNFSR